VCLTASFSARQPYGGLLVLTAVVTALLMVRYLDKFSRAVNERQSRGRCSLMVLVLFLEVLFAYDWEYNLVASLLPLLLVISPATKPQTCFLCVFLTQHSLPFYYTLTDDNIFRVRPHPSAALAMLSLILLQLTVLKLRQYRVAISRLLRRRQKVDIANQ
jgi:prepilin signal peptidase PulO-like enzyme (type II secretory pathway)